VIQITGITGSVAVSITGGGQYRILRYGGGLHGCGPASRPPTGTITNGQWLQLKQTTGASGSVTVLTTVQVGVDLRIGRSRRHKTRRPIRSRSPM